MNWITKRKPAEVHRYEGYVDLINEDALSGWGMKVDENGRIQSVWIDISINAVPVASLSASTFRSDVLDQDMGDGFCGFYFNPRLYLREGRNQLRITFSGTNQLLRGGEKEILVIDPPAAILQDHAGDEFVLVGEEFTRHLINLCNLQPTDSVLDIGCGTGRMAIPLAKYLGEEGSYVGFDVFAPGIEWCQDHIGKHRPNFRFETADVDNGLYNQKAASPASEYRFPCEDESIDVVLAASVFTHLLVDDVRHYLKETSRILKPGGHCLITAFLINKEAGQFIVEGRSRHFTFQHRKGDCLVEDPTRPEAALAYEEELLTALFREAGLQIEEPIRYGLWCGRDKFLSYQDIIVARRLDIPTEAF